MKTKEVLFALLLGMLTLVSCKKEDDFDPTDNYDIATIDISDMGSEKEEFKVFSSENITFEIQRMSLSSGAWVAITGNGCNMEDYYKIDGVKYDWEYGDEIDTDVWNPWCYVVSYILDDDNKVEFFPIECRMKNGIRYGWVRVTVNTVKVYMPKNNTSNFNLGKVE